MIEARPAPRAVAVTVPGFTLPSIGIPAHVGVIFGLSTCAYALSLAAVTGFQSQTDAATAAERAPAIATVQSISQANTALEDRLAAAAAAYQAAAAGYATTGQGFDTLEAKLAELAAVVSQISGSTASMPTSVKLPSISRSAGSIAAPVVHATTSGSVPK